ncbi:MAG TPA: hypothetical protein VHE61_15750 [Opitutaceae bacterium]|nr:hypothetical protein [Opitutaceae bacterium]
MSSPSPVPKLPLWIFFATDALLIALGAMIGVQHPRPWSETIVIAVVVCFVAGAGIGLVPVLVFFERRKNEMLDDRQNALEALARTITSAAEQISIAANGLHEIAELSQKNLRHAEQLPHKLQEKIAEFQAQLTNVNDTEKEELEKELEELRSSETERLQSASDKIARTTAEFAKLEAATHQHLTAANEALSKLAFGTAGAIGKAQAAAEQALSQARQEAARGLGEAAGQAVKSIDAAKAAALGDLGSRFDDHIVRLKDMVGQLQQKIETLQAAASTLPAPVTPSESTPVAHHAPEEAPPAAAAAPSEEAHAPKRTRKPRREEPAPESPTSSPAAPEPVAPPAAESVAEPAPAAAEPAPVTAAAFAEVAPVAPATQEPFVPPDAPETVVPAAPASVGEAVKPVRKRARKTDDEQPALGLALEDTPQGGNGESAGDSPGVVERVLTSDGATRLLVTAYIGIGNRLFIRGAGPGLSWDKGAPLQFVSIGKWRWETNDASAPVQFKLFKNDEQECSALGTLTIDPGYQHEVTAAFA